MSGAVAAAAVAAVPPLLRRVIVVRKWLAVPALTARALPQCVADAAAYVEEGVDSHGGNTADAGGDAGERAAHLARHEAACMALSDALHSAGAARVEFSALRRDDAAGASAAASTPSSSDRDEATTSPLTDFDLADELKDASLVVTVGGDGTALRTSAALSEISARGGVEPPMLAVNSDSLHSVGALCALRASDGAEALAGALLMAARGKWEPETRCRLRVQVCDHRGRRTEELLATNEALVAHACPAGASRLRLTYGDAQRRCTCSGVWVTTAAGVTGAAGSAGAGDMGPPAGNMSLQYVLREEHAGSVRLRSPQSEGEELSSSGVLDASDGNALCVTWEGPEEGAVWVDGAHGAHARLCAGYSLMCTPDGPPLRLFARGALEHGH
eukprot:PRCOL_00004450-RA